MIEPYGRPTAAELVEAVREFLETDVVGATSGQVRFHARVAANALAIVAREMDAGAEPARRYAAALAELGVDDEDALVRAIRAGRFDDRWAEILAALEPSVVDRIRATNPGYLTD